MAIDSEDAPSNSYEIKSADLSLLALILKTGNLAQLEQVLIRQMQESPGFFDQEPVIIDVSGISQAQETLDLQGLVLVLRKHQLVAAAIKGAQKSLLSQAKDLGLLDASDARIKRTVQLADDMQKNEKSEVVKEKPVLAASVLGALVIDKPLRSGQQVYAKGRDLIVTAIVNAGAEVIADGHIHVYAPLRGKAIAGARGNSKAKIFALLMEPELISIAGVYRTTENSLPEEVLGKAAQASLDSGPEGDKLLIVPLVV